MQVSETDDAILRDVAILLVEDEPLLLMEAASQLEDLGCRNLVTAATIESALQCASESDFDLALLDVNLGGRSIEPVARAVAERDRPIIFVTGYAGSIDVSVRGAAIVAKPYTPAALSAALKDLLDGRR